MPGQVALIFVFNHRYDTNIDILEKVYKSRFSNIYYLVPFYNGDKQNVIPVYENSFYFQGYLAQGFSQYFNERYEHYFFLADDLVLNPVINENNYRDHFNLSDSSSYIPEIFNLHHFTNRRSLRFTAIRSLGKASKLYWWRLKDVIKYRHAYEGVENGKELPSRNEALDKLKNHGYKVLPLTFNDIYGFFPWINSKEKCQQAVRFVYRINKYWKKFHLPYPMVASYSDVLIVSKNTIKTFCHYCGVFAANRLFVECALPTALLLASDHHVVTEPELKKTGLILWSYDADEADKYEAEMQRYQYKLTELLQNFPQDKLYIHPIKLSKWKTELTSKNLL